MEIEKLVWTRDPGRPQRSFSYEPESYDSQEVTHEYCGTGNYPDLEALYIVDESGYREHDDVSGLKISYLMNDSISSNHAWDRKTRIMIGGIHGF